MDALVADLDVRRRNLRTFRRSIRQSRLRRSRCSFVPTPLRVRAGHPALNTIEQALATHPAISVPTIDLASQASAWPVDDSPDERAHFTGEYEQRLLQGIGHNILQEAPKDFATAILQLAANP